MAHEVVIPILDQTGDEVVLVSWLKHEGDEVRPGDVICEVETAKATVDIEAEASGILRRKLIEINQSIPALTVVALIAGADEPLPDIDPFYRVTTSSAGPSTGAPVGTEDKSQNTDAAAPDVAKPQRPKGTQGTRPNGCPVDPATPPARAGRIMASPRAKKLAVDHGIDLARITGTGPQGNIVEGDIRQAIEVVTHSTPGTLGANARVTQAKAQRVSEAWHTIPHFYMSITADLTRIVARKEQEGAGVTYTDYFAHAIARAFETSPELNGHWVGDQAQISSAIHLGIVVQTERGLVIPVLRDLAGRTISDIATERQRLIECARTGKLSGSDLSVPTFTISNVGAGDIDDFTAIISPPQIAILAVGSVRRRPVVNDDELAIRPTATFTLGADHRAIDGRQSAAFLNQLKTILEQS